MTHREYLKPGRELVIGRDDATATIVTATEHGVWVDVPNDAPTLERDARGNEPMTKQRETFYVSVAEVEVDANAGWYWQEEDEPGDIVAGDGHGPFATEAEARAAAERAS